MFSFSFAPNLVCLFAHSTSFVIYPSSRILLFFLRMSFFVFIWPWCHILLHGIDFEILLLPPIRFLLILLSDLSMALYDKVFETATLFTCPRWLKGTAWSECSSNLVWLNRFEREDSLSGLGIKVIYTLVLAHLMQSLEVVWRSVDRVLRYFPSWWWQR